MSTTLNNSQMCLDLTVPCHDNSTLQGTENCTTDSCSCDIEQLSEPQNITTALLILDYLNKYYIPIIICVGIIGNTLSAIVFLHTQLRRRSSSYYLAALAISDLVFLVILSFVYIDGYIVEIYSRNVFCQCLTYLSSVASFLSVWLIVSFTVERFIAVQYPLQRPHMCTVRRAKLMVFGLVLVALVSHSYILFTAGISQMCNHHYCGIRAGYEDSMSILNTLDTIVTFILPVLLIVVMNTKIAVQLYRFSKAYCCPVQVHQRKQALDESVHNPTKTSAMHSLNANKNSNHDNLEDGIIVIHYAQQVTGNRSSHGREGSSKCSQISHNRTSASSKILSQETQYNITKMLLLISTVFIVLNFPSYLIRFYGFVWGVDAVEGDTIRLVQAYFMLLFYTHFSVNFLLYSAYGFTFRRALCSFVYDKLACLSQKHRVTFTMYKCMHVIRAGKSVR